MMSEQLTTEGIMSYLIQSANTLEIPSAKTNTTPYFSPMLAELTILSGQDGTICIAEANRAHYEAGEAVRAIIILDPLAWLFQGETTHEFKKDQIAFGMVQKKA